MFMAVKCKLELSRQYQKPQIIIKKVFLEVGVASFTLFYLGLRLIRHSAARKVWLRILN